MEKTTFSIPILANIQRGVRVTTRGPVAAICHFLKQLCIKIGINGHETQMHECVLPDICHKWKLEHGNAGRGGYLLHGAPLSCVIGALRRNQNG